MLVAIFRVVDRLCERLKIESVSAKIRQARWKARLGMMGTGTLIYRSVVVHSPHKVFIGNDVAIAEFVHIWGGGTVSIGDDVLIASHAVITSQTHSLETSLYRQTSVHQPVTIKNNVWIGSGAIVLPGVTIEEGAVIGAGCVVTKDVPEYGVVVGVPGRLVRTLERSSSRSSSS